MTQNKTPFLKRYGSDVAPYAGLVIVFLLFGFLSDWKLVSERNLRQLVTQAFPIMLCCLGATFYWAWGILDLSIAGVLGCAAIGCAYIINAGYPLLGLLAAVVIAAALCVCNSLVSAFLRIPAFLSSLCFMFITNGVLNAVTNIQMIFVSDIADAYATTTTRVITLVFVAVVVYTLFNFTRLGKDCRIMGGNITAARFAGIKITRTMILSFLISGICIGVAAFFTTVRVGKVDYTTGAGVQFNVINAMVFGGMPFGGGRKAKVENGIIGSLSYVILTNGMQLSGVPVNLVALIRGCIFLAVVYLSFPRSSNRLLP